MVKTGEFIHTRYGIGLVTNRYYGNPDDFLGQSAVPVGDIVYPDRMIKQVEIYGYTPQLATSLDMQEIVKGIFEKVYFR